MLARNDLLEMLLDTYGHCDRDQGKRNDCYWGKDGCLRNGWLGRRCKHWHPIEGEMLERLIRVHSVGQ